MSEHDKPTNECKCSGLCFSSEQDLANLKAGRHHTACPLYATEKHPRLFYFEEGESCWCPAPDKVENIVDVSVFFDGDEIEIRFKRFDMTDEQFQNLPEL